MKLSEKQSRILSHLRKHQTATLEELTGLVNDYYANARKHVGVILANMVRRNLVERVKPGVFRLGSKPTKTIPLFHPPRAMKNGAT